MKAVVTSALINTTDRTVDLTVRLYSDAGVLLQTEIILVSIDTITSSIVNSRLLDLITHVKRERATIPYTQAQINAAYLGQDAIIPD